MYLWLPSAIYNNDHISSMDNFVLLLYSKHRTPVCAAVDCILSIVSPKTFVPVYAWKVYGWTGSKVTCMLSLSIRWWWVVSFINWLLYPWGKFPQNPKACIYVSEKRKISSVTSAHYFICITTPPSYILQDNPTSANIACLKKKKKKEVATTDSWFCKFRKW